MDCFTISMTCRIIQKKWIRRDFLMAFLFGLFQALMPTISWLVASFFRKEIQAVDHWVAFGLLAFLGGRMIVNGFKEKDEKGHFNPSKFTTMLTLAIATSIDALAVGLSFIAMNFKGSNSIPATILIIGLASFAMSLFGTLLGIKVGKRVNWPMEQIGGFILIIIGVRILCEHLMG